MKNIYILLLLSLCVISTNAQVEILIIDDMEWPEGDCPAHWQVGGTPCPMVGPGGATGNQSGFVKGLDTEYVLAFGNKIVGEWTQTFWMYVPSGKNAYFNLQGTVPVDTGEFVVGNIFFNQDGTSPGIGFIDDSAVGEVIFSFPHDQWFPITMGFDLSAGIANATWWMYIDEQNVILEGTAFTNLGGDIPTSLGGMSFLSISSETEYHIDDFGDLLLSTSNFQEVDFSVSPNPTTNYISITSEEEIDFVEIYSIEGKLLRRFNSTDQIDVSFLSTGLYLIEVNVNSGKGVQKLIKK